MAFSPTSAGHQSPQSSLPPLSAKQINTGTWGANSNTCVITDEYITTNSLVIVYPTSASATPAGRWSITTAVGSVTVTSSDAESSTLPIAYVVL